MTEAMKRSWHLATMPLTKPKRFKSAKELLKIGTVHDDLTVIGPKKSAEGTGRQAKMVVPCKCSCGRETEKSPYYLRTAKRKACEVCVKLRRLHEKQQRDQVGKIHTAILRNE